MFKRKYYKNYVYIHLFKYRIVFITISVIEYQVKRKSFSQKISFMRLSTVARSPKRARGPRRRPRSPPPKAGSAFKTTNTMLVFCCSAQISCLNFIALAQWFPNWGTREVCFGTVKANEI